MNNADDVFNELMIKEMEIFNKLMNKKVKIDSRITLESIIDSLKSVGMHTAYLERQKTVHSIFFISENETSFLPIKDISDREFNESSLEEISIDEFINILNLEDSIVTEQSNIGLDDLLKIKRPSFLNWKNGETQAVMNIDKIVYASYKDNIISVHMTDGYIVNINNVDAESYEKFCKILMV